MFSNCSQREKVKPINVFSVTLIAMLIDPLQMDDIRFRNDDTDTAAVPNLVQFDVMHGLESLWMSCSSFFSAVLESQFLPQTLIKGSLIFVFYQALPSHPCLIGSAVFFVGSPPRILNCCCNPSAPRKLWYLDKVVVFVCPVVKIILQSGCPASTKNES